jgi:hypothetical protein
MRVSVCRALDRGLLKVARQRRQKAKAQSSASAGGSGHMSGCCLSLDGSGCWDGATVQPAESRIVPRSSRNMRGSASSSSLSRWFHRS